MRGILVTLAILVALACIPQVTPVAEAQPWWPEECQDVHWLNPSQAWGCVMAIASELFTGWAGWEPGPGE